MHTSILGSIDPIVCAIAGVLFLAEQVTLKSGIGIVVVLIAAIMMTLSKQGAKTKAEKQTGIREKSQNFCAPFAGQTF